jgi:hypothetical protein
MADLTVYNNAEQAITVGIEVRSAADDARASTDADQSVFTAEWSLAADAERRVRDGLPASGQFAVTVSAPPLTTATHEWRRSGGTEGLVIWLGTETVEFGTLTN